jgi:hypothetical protein
MKLIGLTGKARSGKDTVAKMLYAQHAFTRIAFADPLKLAAQQMFGLTIEQTWSDAVKEDVIPYWGMSPRQMFQLLGNEAVKPVFGNYVWIKRWHMTYDLFKDTDDIVAPDVRFDHEAECIRSLGGVIVEIQRGIGLVGSTGSHASERGLSTLPDVTIKNDGTLEELHSKLATLMEAL